MAQRRRSGTSRPLVIYGWLPELYPCAYLQQHRAEMLQDFEDLEQASPSKAALWLFIGRDLAVSLRSPIHQDALGPDRDRPCHPCRSARPRAAPSRSIRVRDLGFLLVSAAVTGSDGLPDGSASSGKRIRPRPRLCQVAPRTSHRSPERSSCRARRRANPS
jgi:hypothetical protein